MQSYQSQTEAKTNPEQIPDGLKKSQFFKKEANRFFQTKTAVPARTPQPVHAETEYPKSVFRLFVKHFEYVYARPNDIIMIESCDHLVKVYVGVGERAKLTLRHNTLKDFLSQLPPTHFLRIGRFCAINIQRLTGGNCNEQLFEFDFKISIRPKHFVSHSVFTRIGI